MKKNIKKPASGASVIKRPTVKALQKVLKDSEKQIIRLSTHVEKLSKLKTVEENVIQALEGMNIIIKAQIKWEKL